MNLLARLFRSHATTYTYEYKVADAPPVSTPASAANAKTINPDTLIVKLANGKFRRLSIAGQSVEVPEIRITLRYKRLRDVPDWAAAYLPGAEQP
jgi:hypothetical protein